MSQLPCPTLLSHPGRHATRLKVFQPVALLAGKAEHRAHLLDVSRTGALVHSAAPVAVGERISLRAEGLPIGGTVMWVAAPRLGVAFAAPLADAAIERLTGTAPRRA